MSLAYAVERLDEMGWNGGGSLRTSDGMAYPSKDEVEQEFAEAGLNLRLRHVALFNCYRAEWENGYCVGATEAEAVVFALAQLCGSRAVASV